MDPQIFLLLMEDGLTVGAVYILLATALVMVFNVTRIVFVPQGEFVAYAALTLAAFDARVLPPTAWMTLVSGGLAWVMDIVGLLRSGERRSLPFLRSTVVFIVLPGLAFVLAWLAVRGAGSAVLNVVLSIAIVTSLAPSVYRIAFRPIADASPLVLLIAAISVHFIFRGLGLYMFGPEGVRTKIVDVPPVFIGPLIVPGQAIAVVVACAILIVGLYLFFNRTIYGKALHAAAISRRGARLMGISTDLAGPLTLTLAALVGSVSGVLIAPLMTISYSSGFVLALKGFVGAIVGGLAAYPLAALGAMLIGLLESFAAFWVSSYKEAIVFLMIIPILLWRNLLVPHVDEEEPEV